MRVGCTGHQAREGIDWPWVKNTIQARLASLEGPVVGLSSLAIGADQVFARAVLDAGGELHVVLPTADYMDRLEGQVRSAAEGLLHRASSTTVLQPRETREDGYLAAGMYIVDASDLVIAVWDGEDAVGRGGTGDIVGYAQSTRKRLYIIDPIKRTTREG